MRQAAELSGLLSRVALGDRAAFDTLYRHTSAHLLGVVLRIQSNRAQAEDVLQEVYINVWRAAQSFNPALSQPTTWLVSIARNRAIDSLRRKQTQVSTVLGYYPRFLDRFPTVQALAAASTDEVMALWAGLGYYSRARNLHRCAQAVRDLHGGRFPGSAQALEQLPGIGPSTAAAIAAFCFGERVSIMDGNVRRVLSRVLGWEGDLSVRVHERALTDAAQLLIGVSLGVRFTPAFAHTAPRWLGSIALASFVMMGLCAGFGWVMAQLTGLHPVTLLLGTAPGGIAEMAITAKVLQLGVPVVTAFQVCRLVAVLVLAEPLYRWWTARSPL
mgnify:CR=1 FL=1